MDNPLHELSISRLVRAPRELLYRAWTEPALIQQWFTPRPWTTPVVRTEVRPGGSIFVLMRSPGGEEHPHHGVYLEVVPGRRIVSTDAYTEAWRPAAKPFMTSIVTFDDEAGGTRYTATARHWSAEDRAQHEAMGFQQGWSAATDQLEALVARLQTRG